MHEDVGQALVCRTSRQQDGHDGTVTVDQRLVDAAVTAAGLPARYGQDHRQYHNLGHVEQVLDCIKQLSPEPDHATALTLAAWFHDAIYAPGRSDNEERSAFLAKDTLELVGAPPALGTEVARLVSMTGSHTPEADDRAGAVLCDADLSILGSTPDKYAEYAAAVRAEYSLVPDHLFKPARAQVLRQFLERERLFQTVIGHDLWEAPARDNIRREISELERVET